MYIFDLEVKETLRLEVTFITSPRQENISLSTVLNAVLLQQFIQ